MNKKTRELIIRKIIALAAVIIAIIAVGGINQSLAVIDNQVEVNASMDVMAGNSTTVSGLATMHVSASALKIVKVIFQSMIFILVVLLFFDLVIDGYKLFKKYIKGD